MAAENSSAGPQLRLLRLRTGVSQRAVAREMARRHSRITAIENSVKVSAPVASSYIEAVHRLVVRRERLTLEDLG